jgi:hypothetical protein
MKPNTNKELDGDGIKAPNGNPTPIKNWMVMD